MGALDRKINTLTKDYVDDGAGGYVDVEDVSTAGHHQLATRRGEWWYDPSKGSEIHLVLQLLLSTATLQFLDETVTGAFQALIDAGLARAQRVEVDGSAVSIERALLDATLIDRGGAAIDLTEVGGVTNG